MCFFSSRDKQTLKKSRCSSCFIAEVNLVPSGEKSRSPPCSLRVDLCNRHVAAGYHNCLHPFMTEENICNFFPLG